MLSADRTVIQCDWCGKDIDGLPYQCNECSARLCEEHRLPENHTCSELLTLDHDDFEGKRLSSGLTRKSTADDTGSPAADRTRPTYSKPDHDPKPTPGEERRQEARQTLAERNEKVQRIFEGQDSTDQSARKQAYKRLTPEESRTGLYTVLVLLVVLFSTLAFTPLSAADYWDSEPARLIDDAAESLAERVGGLFGQMTSPTSDHGRQYLDPQERSTPS